MKQFFTKLIVIILIAASPKGHAQCNVNLLTNPGFDSPVQTQIGNNLTGSFTFNGWTMTGGPFNVIQTDGSIYAGGPDNAQNGNQYVDITSAGGTIYQDFTITGITKPVGYSGYFSSREQGAYTDWVASIDIIDLGTNTVVSSSNTRLFTNADGAVPAQDAWYFLYGNVNLPAGNYRFQANLGDYGNFDAASVAQNCVLATNLTSLTGNYAANKTLLNWKAENTQNIKGFGIERSIDGRSFTEIGTLNLSATSQYTFTDVNPPPDAKIFYRLKIMSRNGNFSYTDIIIINTKNNVNFSVSPNPVMNNLTVSGLKTTGDIIVTDALGHLVVSQKIQALQSYTIDVSLWSKGMYIITYFDGTKKATQKFIKL